MSRTTRRRAGERRPGQTGFSLPFYRGVKYVSAEVIDDGGTPRTKIVLRLSSTKARIAAQDATGGGLAGVELAIRDGGASAVHNAFRLEDLGVVSAGRHAAVIFDVEADLTQDWRLKWPGGSQLVKYPSGASISGSVDVEDAVEADPNGAVFVSASDGAIAPLPGLFFAGTVTSLGGYVWRFETGDGDIGGVLDITAASIELELNGSPVNVPIAASSTTTFDLDLSGSAPGGSSTVKFYEWWPVIRSADGKWFAPYRYTLP